MFDIGCVLYVFCVRVCVCVFAYVCAHSCVGSCVGSRVCVIMCCYIQALHVLVRSVVVMFGRGGTLVG